MQFKRCALLYGGFFPCYVYLYFFASNLYKNLRPLNYALYIFFSVPVIKNRLQSAPQNLTMKILIKVKESDVIFRCCATLRLKG